MHVGARKSGFGQGLPELEALLGLCASERLHREHIKVMCQSGYSLGERDRGQAQVGDEGVRDKQRRTCDSKDSGLVGANDRKCGQTIQIRD